MAAVGTTVAGWLARLPLSRREIVVKVCLNNQVYTAKTWYRDMFREVKATVVIFTTLPIKSRLVYKKYGASSRNGLDPKLIVAMIQISPPTLINVYGRPLTIQQADTLASPLLANTVGPTRLKA